jgi:hypothetical protein
MLGHGSQSRNKFHLKQECITTGVPMVEESAFS